jgi:uncharacterized protein (TIGR03437 family)
MTGQGLTTPQVETGAVVANSGPFPTPNQNVVILIDGQRAEVTFAGLAPGSIGLLQVNARVPAGLASSNNVLVGARIGNAALPEALAIAVRAASPSPAP